MNERHPLGVTVLAVILAALAGLVLWLVGADLAFVVAVPAAAIALGLAWAWLGGAEAPTLPVHRPTPRPGVRADLIQLAWSLRGRDGRLSGTGVKRVQAFARRRLSTVGLDLDDPADAARIRRRIGDPVYALLCDNRPMTLTDLEHCLTALEAVTPTSAPWRGHPAS